VAFQQHDAGPVDPEITANFLSSQENVLCAEAWTKGGALLAKVTVTQDAGITEMDLLEACMSNIGVRQTPRAICLDRRARPAA
jgi:hypothetical protein